MDIVTKQLSMEAAATSDGIIRGQERTKENCDNGRGSDFGAGAAIFRSGYDSLLPLMQELYNKPSRGIKSKFIAMLKRVPVEVATVVTIKQVVNSCAREENTMLQDIIRSIGRAIETEALVQNLTEVSQFYTKKMLNQIYDENITSVQHINRKFKAQADDLDMNYEHWSSEEAQNVGKLCLEKAHELGIFTWGNQKSSKGHDTYFIKPSIEVKEYIAKSIEEAQPAIHFPPMLTKPLDWTGFRKGGYLSDELRCHAPMMSIRRMPKETRAWIIARLNSEQAQPVRDAMNKAQSVPYRINKKVLEIATAALRNENGILGLPKHGDAGEPVWTLSNEWKAATATPEEIAIYKSFKSAKKAWHLDCKRRKAKKLGIVNRVQFMHQFKDEPELYFPTFIDWRGRLYFRSYLNPQGHDVIKGCLEYAHPKRLGAVGLFWLKVDLANCCGFDKHDPAIKAQWVDDNWEGILNFLDNPLTVLPPEAETSFTILSAGLELKAALELPNPEDYMSRHIVAMDATCSGSQHFSAMFRDLVGAKYTNLVDPAGDKKEDIYAEVTRQALPLIPAYEADPFVLEYWKNHEVTRSMAKRPVMTYVYNAKLSSCIEYVAEDMVTLGYENNPDYTYNRLATGVAKALREGVELTIPKVAEGMEYLTQLVKKCDKPIKWVTPVGVPVINFCEKMLDSTMSVNSMGVKRVRIRRKGAAYDKYAAINGISPNFIHSLDGAHLCMVLREFDGNITPIHDSFGTHACDVPAMHHTLRDTFYKMYQADIVNLLIPLNEFNEEVPVPEKGTLDLSAVYASRFMFC